MIFALSIVLLATSVYILVRSIPARQPAEFEASSANAVIEQTAAEETKQSVTGHDECVLETLDADELRLYEMIRDAGGELLQMHVVSAKIFSKAKVTRLLDKLENRGLVIRERHGMTNRIRIIK